MNTNGLEIDITKLYDIGQELLDKYKKRLTMIDAKASGDLINTATYDIQLKGYTVELSFDLMNYWWQIEYGRGRNKGQEDWPDPVGDIKNWLQIKIFSGKFMPQPGKPLPTTEKQMKQVAWVIADKISRKGYQRTGEKAEPLQRTLDENMDLLKKFGEIVADQIGEEVIAEFKSLNMYNGKTYSKTQRISPTK